jgi:DNA-binding winged helix-turn-helix (wHTH) protein
MNTFRRDVSATLRFGRFMLDICRRKLFADEVPVPIGARAFDVLTTLVEARGRLVTKNELTNRVWPETVVEENNLQVHISALRKALGRDRDFIKTICGRGYCFIAEISAIPVPDVLAQRYDLPSFTGLTPDLASRQLTGRIAWYPTERVG